MFNEDDDENNNMGKYNEDNSRVGGRESVGANPARSG